MVQHYKPCARYFEGIQGDNVKKGELFGIENIFKLHEDKLATKMAVCYYENRLYSLMLNKSD